MLSGVNSNPTPIPYDLAQVGDARVMVSHDAGNHFTDISGNLPDIASDALVISHHGLALGTDDGVFTAREGQGGGTTWARLGAGLPNVVVDDLTAGPGGYIYAATHGRGAYRLKLADAASILIRLPYETLI